MPQESAQKQPQQTGTSVRYSLSDIQSKKKLVERRAADLACRIEEYRAQLDQHSAVFEAALAYNRAACQKLCADTDALFDELVAHVELQRNRFRAKVEAHVAAGYCCRFREATGELLDRSQEEIRKMQAGVDQILREGLTCYGSVYQNVAIVEGYFAACDTLDLRLQRLRSQQTELADAEPFNAKKDFFRELKEFFCKLVDASVDRRKLDRCLQGATVYRLRDPVQQAEKKRFLGIF